MADMKDHIYFTIFGNAVKLTPYIFYTGNPFTIYI